MLCNLDGFILIDKISGITSYDIIRKIKRILKIHNIKTKIGHTGTLDPFATGLMIIVFGKYTKLSDYFMTESKEYTGVLKLGIETDTLDSDGKIINIMDLPENFNIDEKTKEFIGEISQITPKYSSTKYNGTPSYKLARDGIKFEQKMRKVHVYDLNLSFLDTDKIAFKATVSKGTYIRQLMYDIARSAGSTGHLIELRRERIGSFCIKDSINYNLLDENSLLKNIMTVDESVFPFPCIDFNMEQYYNYKCGKPFLIDKEDGKYFIKLNGDIISFVEVIKNKINNICVFKNE